MFSYVKWPRKPNCDLPEGLKLYFLLSNWSKWVKVVHFGVILAIFELKMVNLRVKIQILTLRMVKTRFSWSFFMRKHRNSMLPVQKSAEVGQNRPVWGHLGVILALFELQMVNLRMKINFLTFRIVKKWFHRSFFKRKHQTSTLSGQKYECHFNQ